MTKEDLANYSVHVYPSLQGTYRGRRVYTPRAPTSGPVIIHMLNLMEHYHDLLEEGRTSLNNHRLIEAMKCECPKCVPVCSKIHKLFTVSRTCRSVQTLFCFRLHVLNYYQDSGV